MRYPCLALLVAAMMLATLDFTAAAHQPLDRASAPSRPLSAGTLARGRSVGGRAMAGGTVVPARPRPVDVLDHVHQASQDGNEPQSVTLLSGSDRRNGRSIDARVPPSGFWADPKAGPNKLVGKPRVTREGP